jgi:general secretion pathway protein K
VKSPAPPSRARRAYPRQRGAAVLLALFIVTLATLIVSELFWRQFVLFRTAQNQQESVQARLLLDGAQQWARLILLDQAHPAYDTLTDPWAQPLAPTPLEQLGDATPLVGAATIEGSIEDAQARFNLRNLLLINGAINPGQFAVLDKLASLLHAPSGTADLIAGYVAQSYASLSAAGGSPLQASGGAVAGAAAQVAVARAMPPVLPEDLIGIPGIDPGAAQALSRFLIMLDRPNTAVNFNTAPAEIMAATVPGLSLSDALALASERDRAYFVSVADIQNRLNGRGGEGGLNGVSTNSSYFIVQGIVHLDHAATRERALLRRAGTGSQGQMTVLWKQEE